MQYWFKALLLAFFILPGLLLTSSCAEPEPVPVELPEDIAAVTDGFISALQRGDKAVARKFVVSSAREDFDEAFNGPDAFKPGKTLKPLVFEKTPAFLQDDSENEARAVYAAKNDDEWQSIDITLRWMDEEPIEIYDWKLRDRGPPPPEVVQKQLMKKFTPLFMLGIAIFALIALGLLVWLVRRKPHVFAPNSNPETRSAASTTQRDID